LWGPFRVRVPRASLLFPPSLGPSLKSGEDISFSLSSVVAFFLSPPASSCENTYNFSSLIQLTSILNCYAVVVLRPPDCCSLLHLPFPSTDNTLGRRKATSSFPFFSQSDAWNVPRPRDFFPLISQLQLAWDRTHPFFGTFFSCIDHTRSFSVEDSLP